MRNGLKCLQIKIYASGLAHEKFGVWNEVAARSKFLCGPLDLNSWVEPSSETQGRSIWSWKTAAEFFKNGQESRWDATLNEPVPWLIWMLVCDWAPKKFRDLLIRRSLPANSTVCRTCLAPAGELSWRRVFSFSVKINPQRLLYQFHSIHNWSLTREIRNFFKIPSCWACALVAWCIAALG